MKAHLVSPQDQHESDQGLQQGLMYAGQKINVSVCYSSWKQQKMCDNSHSFHMPLWIICDYQHLILMIKAP
jgi:hypothetical protein